MIKNLYLISGNDLLKALTNAQHEHDVSMESPDASYYGTGGKKFKAMRNAIASVRISYS